MAIPLGQPARAAVNRVGLPLFLNTKRRTKDIGRWRGRCCFWALKLCRTVVGKIIITELIPYYILSKITLLMENYWNNLISLFVFS